jgi:hypothetical protein
MHFAELVLKTLQTSTRLDRGKLQTNGYSDVLLHFGLGWFQLTTYKGNAGHQLT